MKATLMVECIGDANRQYIKLMGAITTDFLGKEVSNALIGNIPSRYYVAEIIGLDAKYKYKRRFLKPKKDYINSSGNGNRGVYAWYVIDSNSVYEVKESTSWKKFDRYFCTVNNDGDIVKINDNDLDEWLKTH